MRSHFYSKLAIQNISKNRKTYMPFLIAAIFSIMLMYIFLFIAGNPGMEHIKGGVQLVFLLNMGRWVMALFSCIFLFYINSFLIRRRKKELGLYSLLGMEKRHIAKVLCFETIYIGIAAIVIGILAGIVFSEISYVLMLRCLRLNLELGFYVSLKGIRFTVILFAILFLCILIHNILQVHINKPIELLRSEHSGEKEPKTKWFLALLGVVSLSAGYYLAITTGTPLESMEIFLVATVLVILGTYYLFTAGSIALLKFLKKRKKYYYQTKHFIAVSGLLYRMKQNAVGLANICILSTAVLVVFSSVISMYVGQEDILRTRYMRNVLVEGENISEAEANAIHKTVEKLAQDQQVDMTNVLELQADSYSVSREDNKMVHCDIQSMADFSNIATLVVITEKHYEKMTGQQITLADNEVMVADDSKGNVTWDTVIIEGKEFRIKHTGQNDEFIEALADGMQDIADAYLLIVSDNTRNELVHLLENEEKVENPEYMLGFDTKADKNKQKQLLDEISKYSEKNGWDLTVECAELAREEFLSIYGGVLFVGIYLGTVFLLAAVLIIYYKQITEGYEDRNRFQIMCKVGMDEAEVKASIRSQVLTVFFLPLVTAGIHCMAAFPCLQKLLMVLNLRNASVFAVGCIATFLVFAVIYGIVFAITSRNYYKIVRN